MMPSNLPNDMVALLHQAGTEVETGALNLALGSGYNRRCHQPPPAMFTYRRVSECHKHCKVYIQSQ